MSLPLVRNMGSYVGTAGTFLNKSWVAGHDVGWMAVCVMVTQNEAPAAPGVPNALHLAGFTQVPNSPIGTGTAGGPGSTRITAYRLIATSNAMPDFRVYNPGNMIEFRVFFLSDQDLTTPFLTLTSGAAAVQATAQTGVSIPGADSTGTNDVLFILCVSHALDTGSPQFDSTAWVGGSGLANFTERSNDSLGSGNGGGLAILTGTKAVGGVIGATTGTLLAASKQAMLVLAVKGAGAAATVPASHFLCAGGCASPVGGDHWHGETGTPFTSVTDPSPHGARSWRSTPVSNISARHRVISEDKHWERAYFFWPSEPSGDCEPMRLKTASGGNSPELRYRKATNDFVGAVGDQVTTAVPFVANQLYEFAIAGDVSANPRTCKFSSAGVDKGTASLAVAAGSLVRAEVGASCGTAVSADVVLAGIRFGALLSAYPPTAGAQHLNLQLTSDGTHSYDTAGDYKYDNTDNVPLAATDTYTRLLGLLTATDAGASRLTRVGAAVTEWLEWLLTGMVTATSIPCFETVFALRGGDANAHAQTARLLSGASTVDEYTARSFPGSVIQIAAKHHLLDPTGVAITQALMNAYKFRWPFSATGLPEIAGLRVEVEYYAPGGPPTLPENQQASPLHQFPAAGTYSVSKTVRDNDGLESKVTQSVTVA